MFSKLLVANRGEIALRILRTARELSIPTVALYSGGDRESTWVKAADEAWGLEGSSPAETYLNQDAIIDVCLRCGADSVHPGYGFLSENASFARRVRSEGLTFVGPPPEAIAVMGDKLSARTAARDAGVLGVPGTDGAVTSAEEIVAFGEAHGWPVAIKAAFGGGGRGMRVVSSPELAGESLESAQREALAAFGRQECYLERYLTWPRHVEVQVISDTHGNFLSLGDRDCSAQRRHQKLVEESPAPGLTEELRAKMSEAALNVARACGYVNAGTVEFLVQEGEFYFLEMNTRLQVEHPVTEEVLGIDLVAMQLRVAAGEPLGLSSSDLAPRGHSFECRINAEDVAAGRFLPSPGTITTMATPAGPGVRLDSGYQAGDEVSQLFDNLIAKLVVWAPDRESARLRMLRALAETRIEGISTTLPALEAILSHEDFASSTHSTRWLEDVLDLSHISPVQGGSAAPDPGGKVLHEVSAEVEGRLYSIRLWLPAPAVAPARRPRPRSSLPAAPSARRGAPDAQEAEAVAVPMQGTIVKVLVTEGDTVEAGQTVCVLEAMKMENAIAAGRGGTVREVRVSPGATVGGGDVVVVIG